MKLNLVALLHVMIEDVDVLHADRQNLLIIGKKVIK